MIYRRYLLSLLLGLAAAPPLTAFEVRGSLRRADGSALPEARVELLRAGSNHERLAAVLAGGDRASGGRRAVVDAVAVDGEGWFRLRAPGAGLYQIEASAPGYLPMRYPLLPLARDLELPPVTLRRAGPLEVRLRDPAGRPLPGALVSAAAEGGVWKSWAGAGWAPSPRLGWSDGEGTVRLERALGEALRVSARRRGSAHTASTLSAAGERVELQVPSSEALTLTLREADGRPAAGAVVAAEDSLPLGRTNSEGRLALTLGPGEGEPRLLILTPDARIQSVAPPYGGAVTLAPPARVAGRVLDPSGEPVTGALVWPGHDPGRTVLSDAEGRFSLTGPAGGRWRLQAHAPGHLPAARSLEPAASELVELRLPPALDLGGRVRDLQGRAVAGASVAAVEIDLASPEASVRPIRLDPAVDRAVSGAGGALRLRALAPGRVYALTVSKAGFLETTVEVGPLTPEAPPVEILLTAGRLAFGRVLDSAEQPLEGAVVSLRAAGEKEIGSGSPEEDPFAGRTDAEGLFRLQDLPAQKVDLHARASGFAPVVVRGLHMPEGGEAVDLGTVVLLPGAVIRGRVTDSEGRAMAEAKVWVADEPTAARRIPLRTEPPAPAAEADAEGRFHLAELEPGGKVSLWVDAPGFLPATVADVEAPRAEPLEITLEPAASLRGRVVDEGGAPVAGAEIAYRWQRPEDERQGEAEEAPLVPELSARSDEQGAFRIEEAPAGRAELGAAAEGFLSSEVQQLLLRQGEELGGVVLTLARGAVLEGRVLDDLDVPVAGARVRSDGPFARADGEGRYRLAGLAPGRQQISAESPGFEAAAREVEVLLGRQSLDFRLRGGLPVAGLTLDAHGRPLPGVRVEIVPVEGEASQTYEIRSDPDGAFRFERVVDGRYRLRGSKEGFVGELPEPIFEMAGEALSDLEVRLGTGSTVEGRVLGLDFEELAAVEVAARSARGEERPGRVDYEGTYVVEDLGPGDWTVEASLDAGERLARARVAIEPGRSRLRRDLEFGTGLGLGGLVLHTGEAVPGIRVQLRGLDLAVERFARAGADGRFRIDDLEPGAYRLSLAHHPQRLVYNEDLHLVRSEEIVVEIATAGVSGVVVDAAKGLPLGRALVELRQLAAGGEEASAFASATEADGRFQHDRLSAGRYLLRVRREGYEPLEERLELAAGTRLDGLRPALAPAAGLLLDVRLASGRRPRHVHVLGRDAGGRVFAESRAAAGGGATRFGTLPAGTWDLLVAAEGGAAVSARAVVPGDGLGEPLSLVLPAAGRLRLRLPELLAEDRLARLRVLAPDGRPHRSLGWGGQLLDEWPLAGGSAVVEGLPAGTWTLLVEAADGRVWQGAAVTTGGPEVEVSLP